MLLYHRPSSLVGRHASRWWAGLTVGPFVGRGYSRSAIPGYYPHCSESWHQSSEEKARTQPTLTAHSTVLSTYHQMDGGSYGRFSLNEMDQLLPDAHAPLSVDQRQQREFILNVLNSAPSQREARQFLKRMSAATSPSSAAIAQSALAHQTAGPIANNNNNMLTESRHLQPVALIHLDLPSTECWLIEHLGKLLAQIQRLGVHPIVVVSLPSIATSTAATASSGFGFGSFLYTADSHTESVAHLHALTDAVENSGGRAYPISEGVFVPNYDATFDSVDVQTSPIRAALTQHRAPLLLPMGIDPISVRVEPISAIAATTTLSQALTQPWRHWIGSDIGDSLIIDPIRFIYLGQLDQLPKLHQLLSHAAEGTTSAAAAAAAAENGDAGAPPPSTLPDLKLAGGHRFINLEHEFDRLSSLYSLGSTLNLSPSLKGSCAPSLFAKADEALHLCRACLGLLPATATGVVASVMSDPALIIKGIISERPISGPTKSIVSAQQRQQPSRRVGADGEPPPQSSQFTLLRHGYKVHTHTSLHTCNLPKLQHLLQASFGRNLDAQGYFGRLQSLQSTPGGLTIIVAGDYMGAVIVTRERLPMSDGLASSEEEDRRFPYLDKLAVHPDSQGTGLADILWSSLQRAFPTCVWRSRVANKVNGWYFERATGHWRIPQASGASPYWICFWYQGNDRTVDCQRMLASIIPVVESIPPSFTS